MWGVPRSEALSPYHQIDQKPRLSPGPQTTRSPVGGVHQHLNRFLIVTPATLGRTLGNRDQDDALHDPTAATNLLQDFLILLAHRRRPTSPQDDEGPRYQNHEHDNGGDDDLA